MKQLPPENSMATRSDIERIGNHLRAHDKRFDRLEARIDGVDQSIDGLDQRMGRIEQRMDRIEERMDRLDDRLHDLQGAIREQTRNYIVANAALMVSLTGIALSAAAVL